MCPLLGFYRGVWHGDRGARGEIDVTRKIKFNMSYLLGHDITCIIHHGLESQIEMDFDALSWKFEYIER